MKWNEIEIALLTNEYPKVGIKGMLKLLPHRTRASITNKISSLKLVTNKDDKYSEVKFSEVIKNSNNITDACRNLGLKTFCGNRNTVKYYIKLYNLDTSHFKLTKRKGGNVKPLINYLTANSSITNNTLKKRLLKENLIEYKCSGCGLEDYWNGNPITLQLDHINGINNDNRLENLRLLCPNCHSQTSTFGHKNIGNSGIDVGYVNETKNYCKCGKEIWRGSKKCITCNAKTQQKVDRPPYEILLVDIKELGYRGTGRKYGVSDNTIRKWKKKYENK